MTAQDTAALQSTAQHITARHSMALHCTAHWSRIVSAEMVNIAISWSCTSAGSIHHSMLHSCTSYAAASGRPSPHNRKGPSAHHQTATRATAALLQVSAAAQQAPAAVQPPGRRPLHCRRRQLQRNHLAGNCCTAPGASCSATTWQATAAQQQVPAAAQPRGTSPTAALPAAAQACLAAPVEQGQGGGSPSLQRRHM